jgi:hypothetical protein
MKPDRHCRAELGRLPRLVTHRYEIVRVQLTGPRAIDGMVWLRCPRLGCGRWNVFAVVPIAA